MNNFDFLLSFVNIELTQNYRNILIKITQPSISYFDKIPICLKKPLKSFQTLKVP